MKKVLGIIFLSIILIASTVLAAYPEDLENSELEQISDDEIVKVSEEELQNAESGIEEVATENELETENDVTLEEYYGDVEDDDIYQVDTEVTINQIVDGNVYVMGEVVKFDNAVIYGNAYVMGKNVEFENVEINGSVYVLAEDIEISGIANDIYACGSNINFNEGSYIWRSARIAGESLKLNGTIGRDAFFGVSNLTIEGNAIINGTLNYVSQNEATISEQAQISDINFEKQEIDNEDKNGFDIMSYIGKLIRALFTTAIVALIIVSFVDKFKKMNRTENISTDLLKNAGIGTLFLIFVPIITICLSISNVACLIGIIGLLLYIVAICASTSITSMEVATRILEKSQDENIGKGKKIGVAVLVSLVFWVIGLIPVVGTIVKLAFVLIGLGIIFNLAFIKIKSVEN